MIDHGDETNFHDSIKDRWNQVWSRVVMWLMGARGVNQSNIYKINYSIAMRVLFESRLRVKLVFVGCKQGIQREHLFYLFFIF